MMTISVCIGSACHKRGSYAILNRFKALVEEKGVSDKVSVTPAFCFGEWKNGVTVKVDDILFLGMTEESAEDVFNRYVLPKLS
mgnify:CR=1 FL=1